MAKGGKVQHWKHGWIPLTPWAKAYADGRTSERPTPGKAAPSLSSLKAKRAATDAAIVANARQSIADRAAFRAQEASRRSKLPMPDKIDGVDIETPADRAHAEEAWATAGAILDKYERRESQVTPGLVRLASANGGHMQGLKHKLKDQESLARKLYNKSREKDLTIGQYGNRVGDALRYTFIAPDEDYGPASQRFIDGLRTQGYKVDVENTWTPGSEYKGVNTNVSKGGYIYELQMHTAESFRVKSEQHDLYKIARSETATPEEQSAAKARMKANGEALATPFGAADVH